MSRMCGELYEWASASSPVFSDVGDENDAGVFALKTPLGVDATVYSALSCVDYEYEQQSAQFHGLHASLAAMRPLHASAPAATAAAAYAPSAPAVATPSYRDLILTHIAQDMAHTCAELGLPLDPLSWTVAQTSRWLVEVCRQFDVPLPPQSLDMSGARLAAASCEELCARMPLGGGETIHSQFQLWRTAFDSQIGSRAAPPQLSAGVCVKEECDRDWAPPQPPLPPREQPSNAAGELQAFCDVFVCASSAAPSLPPPPATAHFYMTPPPSLHAQQPPLAAFAPLTCCAPPTQPTTSYAQVTSAHCGNGGGFYASGGASSPSASEVSSGVDEVPPHGHYAPPFVPRLAGGLDERFAFGADASAYFACGGGGALALGACSPRVLPPPPLSCSFDASSVSGDTQRSSGDELGAASPCALSVGRDSTSGASTGGGSTGSVHLWHFIRELLDRPAQYSSCVRWINRHEGTFKIESSHLLARYWGQRKNRSQMNYDKLSRSLRQYYKKGIIEKPEKKQRLIYKFLPPYSA